MQHLINVQFCGLNKTPHFTVIIRKEKVLTNIW